MMPTSIGNLASMLVLRQGNIAAKADLPPRMQELTTGISSDIPAHLQGNTARLSHIEARLQTLSAHGRSAAELAGRAERMQIVLDSVQSTTRSMSTSLIGVTSAPSSQSLTAATSQAAAQLSAMIDQLNVRAAGQHIFSGTRTNTAPLADSTALLAAIRTAIGPTTDIGAVLAAVDTFFDASPGGGGFFDMIYQGSMDATSTAIAPGQSANLDVNATAPAIRAALKGMALLVLTAEPPHASDIARQTRLVEAAQHGLLGADAELSGLRGEIGTLEAMVEQARSRNGGEHTTLQLVRGDLIGIDPYEAATAVTEAEARLEAIYALTARLSRLSLAAYL